MGISICIGSVRAETLRFSIEAIRRQDYVDWELIVVLQGNEPESLPVVQRYAEQDSRIRYIHLSKKGVSLARNRGIAESKYDLISFTDDDCEPRRDWLAFNVECFEKDPDLSTLWGSLIALPPTRFGISFCPEYIVPELVYDPKRDAKCMPVENFGSGNLTLRKSAWRDLRFDENMGPGTPIICAEDIDLLERLIRRKIKIRFSPQSVVFHTYGRRHGLKSAMLKAQYAMGMGYLAAKDFLASPTKGAQWQNMMWKNCIKMRLAPNMLHRLPQGLLRWYYFRQGYRKVVSDYLIDKDGLLVEKRNLSQQDISLASKSLRNN